MFRTLRWSEAVPRKRRYRQRTDDSINQMFTTAEVEWRDPVTIPGPLPIRIWPAVRTANTAAVTTHELVL